jgi:hypothetical protein
MPLENGEGTPDYGWKSEVEREEQRGREHE